MEVELRIAELVTLGGAVSAPKVNAVVFRLAAVIAPPVSVQLLKLLINAL
jgi:hypothetical protein